jgi:hypothetical protein
MWVCLFASQTLHFSRGDGRVWLANFHKHYSPQELDYKEFKMFAMACIDRQMEIEERKKSERKIWRNLKGEDGVLYSNIIELNCSDIHTTVVLVLLGISYVHFNP